MVSVLKKIFGTKHERDIRSLRPLVERINRLEEEYQSLPEHELKAKTDEFRRRLADGQTLDDIMCEAFAVVKNACRRLKGTSAEVCGHDLVWDMIPFDVQIIGGIVLHRGRIAEMATGEGKTLVATMPLYLNALGGKNVQLVTHNDFLARRDAQWMGRVYEYLGLSVGCIQNQMTPEQRRQEYGKDITYGTNSEFGFDYLRDNGMAYRPENLVQRGYEYAIIDEVDSILIDEARTPLIISGPAPVSTHQYFELKPRVEGLVRKQRVLCNRLVREARELLDQGEEEEAQLRLYQVHHGMPKHKQLMHMLEDPAVRRLHEQIEGAMLTDMRKEQARALREELLFTIDERGRDASLTDQGPQTLEPSHPNHFKVPDIVKIESRLDTQLSNLEEKLTAPPPADGVAERDKDALRAGIERIRKRRVELGNLYMQREERVRNVAQLIRAYCLYERDVEYVVQENRVMIVDEFTGRVLPGRRWSEGLHQAVEAKEGVKIESETQTLATITIQNYFRMYNKLAGMTGTAETEASEFHEIYGLDVVVIPTNRPVRRVDSNDVIYKTQREKFRAVVEEVSDCHRRGQPVLVGTVTVDTSELLSRMLKRAGIPHSVLNAKNHESEAEIVTRAGQPGAVTIATNMAGRGTDIKLGPGVVHIDRRTIESPISLDDRYDGSTLRRMLEERPCGLHVVGSERHESRRIDRQLRGRCARQGDPGSSRFYVSLEDDLMRLFGSDRIAGIMSRLGLEEGQQLEHKWLNRSIETAQRRVEQQNFGIRKRTLEYDDVMNRQREVVYGLRTDVLSGESARARILEIFRDVIDVLAEGVVSDDEGETVAEFVEAVSAIFPVAIRRDLVAARKGDAQKLADTVFEGVKRAYEMKMSYEEEERGRIMERQIVLHCIDTQWQEYLRAIDELRQGVGLRAYGQRDPLIEYKREAFEMFEDLMNTIYQEISSTVFRSTSNIDNIEPFLATLPRNMVHDQISVLGAGGAPRIAPPPALMPGPAAPEVTVRRENPKVGRNDPCPCGSGKKYKKCCGS